MSTEVLTITVLLEIAIFSVMRLRSTFVEQHRPDDLAETDSGNPPYA